jgi:hypothetical protein
MRACTPGPSRSIDLPRGATVGQPRSAYVWSWASVARAMPASAPCCRLNDRTEEYDRFVARHSTREPRPDARGDEQLCVRLRIYGDALDDLPCSPDAGGRSACAGRAALWAPNCCQASRRGVAYTSTNPGNPARMKTPQRERLTRPVCRGLTADWRGLGYDQEPLLKPTPTSPRKKHG